MELSYVFIIFFIALGPLKVIPPFYLAMAENSDGDIRKIAFKGVLLSFAIVVLVGFTSDMLLRSWRLTLPAFILAGGVILFITSLKSILEFKGPKFKAVLHKDHEYKKELESEISQKALTPVTIPIIVSPIGLVAVIVALSLAHLYHTILQVLGLLVVIMVLNFISMVYARFIMGTIGFTAFSIIGWAFAILQAGLAVQFIVNSIHKLFNL